MTHTSNYYGVTQQRIINDTVDLILEEIKISGYSIVPSVLDEYILEECRKRIDIVYQKQEEEFGRSNLEKINDLDIARAILTYDEFFLHQIAAHPFVLKVVEKVLGSYFVLHLQNAIINRPDKQHHQSSWHRDLPYHNFVISKPLSVNAFFCIDPFTEETGCTYVIPFSHREEIIPSEEYIQKHAVPLIASAGSVVFFDSMLLHRAGTNSSSIVRRGINNVYVTGIIKQQIDLPNLFKDKYAKHPLLSKLLGYESSVPISVTEYREKRKQKKSN